MDAASQSPLLLQVANVCTLTGGPGALTWTITRALPKWRHAVLFVNSGTKRVSEGMQREFGCPVECDRRGVDRMIEAHRPTAIIYHNSGPGHIRSGEFTTLYWQHSGQSGGRPARKQCDHAWTVSEYLARAIKMDASHVVYQPVPLPPDGKSRHSRFKVGRLCTPHPRKWVIAEQLPLYQRLADDNPDVDFEFVGCPEHLKPELMKACRRRAAFHHAGWQARSLFWGWHAMLYHSKQTETYGRTVCDAQRAGCVPIVDNKGGFREQITHGVDGMLCDDVCEFSKAINDVRSRFDVMSHCASNSGNVRGSLMLWARKFLNTIGHAA